MFLQSWSYSSITSNSLEFNSSVLLFPMSLKVDCYLICVVILNGQPIFDRLHLEASSMACDEVLSHQIFTVCFCLEYIESQYGVFGPCG